MTLGQYLFLTDDSGVGNPHAEPHLPFYRVERLNGLMARMIAGELAGRRLEPEPDEIIRTVGDPVALSGAGAGQMGRVPATPRIWSPRLAY